MKKLLISGLVHFLIWAALIGIGIWYVTSSINGASITYSSMDSFMNAIGVTDGDISSANGCFMCGYVSDLFTVLGQAAELFWETMLEHLWLLIVVGFGIFLFIHTIQHLYKSAQETTKLDGKDKIIQFKPWFDPIWKQATRILVVGALIGALGMGGTDSLKAITNITIRPVLFTGAELSMAASGISDSATCGALTKSDDEIMGPVLQPFMCTIGNLNSVMLAGASGGFALMNYAHLDMGGGALTWLAGLGVLIMFIVIGFDLFFQILSVIFKLIFLIVFAPMILAAAAFEKTWKMASGITSGAITMLINSAVKIAVISLKVTIIYAVISFAADEYYPGPNDGFSVILPPLMNQTMESNDAQTLSIKNVFSDCERISLVDGVTDADKFKQCFIEKRKIVETKYPGAFDFMDNAWDFILMALGMFGLYFYVLSPRVDKLLASAKIENGAFDDFGLQLKKFGQNLLKKPEQIAEIIEKAKKESS